MAEQCTYVSAGGGCSAAAVCCVLHPADGGTWTVEYAPTPWRVDFVRPMGCGCSNGVNSGVCRPAPHLRCLSRRLPRLLQSISRRLGAVPIRTAPPR